MKPTLWALLFFFVLVAVGSWPLPLHAPDQVAIGTERADVLHLLYGLASGTRALLSHPQRYFDATFFYPYPQSLAFLDQIFGLCLLAAPVEAASGNIVLAYNVVWFLTFFVAALGAFTLTKSLTVSTPAGLLAGVLYAFYPLRWHSAGILPVIALMWMPFALWCLHRWVWTDRLRWFVGFVTLAALQFLSSGYSGVFLLVAALLYGLTLLGADRAHLFGLLRNQRRWMTVVIALAGLFLVPFVAPMIYNLSLGLVTPRSLGSASLWSARPLDFLTPYPGSLIGRLLPDMAGARHPLFPGGVALVLVWAWIARRGWRRHRHRVDILFYLVLSVAGMVLALGPLVTVAGVHIPLPFALVHYLVPGADLIRSAVRFAFPASLGIAVLAGAAFADFMERRRLPSRPCLFWSTALITLAAVELYPGPLRLFDPLPDVVPPVYHRLAANPQPLALVELPLPLDESQETAEDALPLMYSLVHGKRLVNGMGANVPPVTRDLRILLQRFPEPDTLARLREIGVSLVILNMDRYPPAAAARLAAAIESAPGITVVEREPPIWVCEVTPAPRTRLPP